MTVAAVGAVLAALAILSALVVRFTIGRGVLDIPGARSSHDRPTPKGGGLGIAAAYATGLVLAWSAGMLPREGRHVAALLAASLLIAGVAWADDLRPRGFGFKLGGQIAASLVLVIGGPSIERLGPVPLGPLGVPITLVWLVVATNAVNFIDGLNGLASGCVLIAAATVATGSAGHPLPAAALLPLAAGIAGFLPFNFPRARIFMGDVGSQLCGLVLASSAGSVSRYEPWGALLVPVAMAPILVDVAFTLARRWRAGDRLTEAHRGHLYQLAHRAGSPAWQVTLAFWALTIVCSVFGLRAAHGPWPVTLAAIAAAALPLGVAAAITMRAAGRAQLTRW